MYRYSSNSVQAPMPPGWEAKYDPTSRRWFYMNHATKTTQWTDPRVNYQQQKPPAAVRPQQMPMTVQQQQRPVQTQQPVRPTPPVAVPMTVRQQQPVHTGQPYANRPPTTTSFIEPDPAKRQSLLEKYNVDVDLVNSLLRQFNNREEKVEESLRSMGYMKKMVANPAFIDRLRGLYPDAPIPTIKDQLLQCNNSYQGAQMGLSALGYKKGGHKPQASAPRVAAPKKPEPKKVVDPVKAKRELKNKFPRLDDTTIDLCLKVAKNDVEMAAKILEAKMKSDAQGASKTVTRITKKIDPTPEPEAPRDLAPKVFGSEDAKTSDQASTSSSTTLSSVGSYLESKGDDFLSKFLDKKEERPTATPIVRTREYQQKKIVVKSTVKRHNAYKSSLCIEPVGANPALCKGPDPASLLKVLAERSGPNKANCKGAQASNRLGPNLANRCGPGGLATGPVGPMMTAL